mmetsp:Transcript_81447/g.141420  ORF Transcript_81447/g.141420 Transcript_81447/m.141420 type:complete len:419 (+) Transcript_81447:93-1349(+)
MAETIPALALATSDETCTFSPMPFQRRAVGDKDVLIDMKFCGVCHTDVHVAANHMKSVKPTKYPCVPGHELAGVCVDVGAGVTRIKVGDHVGVGCMVDSCLECEACLAGDEQKCKWENVGTFDGDSRKFGRADNPDAPLGQTYGGYTSMMVVHEHFAIKIPKSYPLEAAGPVMCAGITMYDPLKAFGAKEGTRVGIVGLGGLGVMGIKIANALGCQVVAISRGAGKEGLAKDSGARAFIASSSPEDMAQNVNSLDLILNTIPAEHDYVAYTPLLANGGKQVFLGITSGFAAAMFTQKCSLGCCSPPTYMSSLIGGIKNTQEVMDLCARDNILPQIRLLPVTEISRIYEDLESGNDAGVRYVLDIGGTLNQEAADSWVPRRPQMQEHTGLQIGTILKTALWMLGGRMFGCCTSREGSVR